MIEIHGLRKRLRKRWVLNGIDLTIHDGESIVIIGKSGTRKSVLLKHIMGLMRPDEGSIKIDGEEITTLEGEPQLAVRRRIGYLFQNSALFDSLTVEQNIALAMAEGDASEDPGIRRRVTEKLALVGLKDIEQLKPSSLPGGMPKRVGRARA